MKSAGHTTRYPTLQPLVPKKRNGSLAMINVETDESYNGERLIRYVGEESKLTRIFHGNYASSSAIIDYEDN